MSIFVILFLLSTALSMIIFGYIAWASRRAFLLGKRLKRITDRDASGALLKMVGYLSLGINVQAVLWILVVLVPRLFSDLREMPLYIPVVVTLMVIAQIWTSISIVRLWRTLWP